MKTEEGWKVSVVRGGREELVVFEVESFEGGGV